MARIRSVKPDFWCSEQVLDLSRDARLLFIGLWNFADDEGRFKWAPRTIRAQVFPGDDDITSADVERLLSETVRVGLLERYGNGATQYAHVTGWRKHQRIDKRQPAKHPGPKDSGSAPGMVAESNGSVPLPVPDGSEGIGSEGIGSDPKAGTGTVVDGPRPEAGLWERYDDSRRQEYLQVLWDGFGKGHPTPDRWDEPRLADKLFSFLAGMPAAERATTCAAIAAWTRRPEYSRHNKAKLLTAGDWSDALKPGGGGIAPPAAHSEHGKGEVQF